VFMVVRGVAPAKGDLLVDQGNESRVGDGDAMGVVAYIAHRLLRISEGPLGPDDLSRPECG
jgi:hypothetical protein